MNFREKIESNKFTITCEVGPPKGINVDSIISEAELLKGRVDAVNVTDLQSSVMKLGSLAMCYLLKEKGHEPILQMTARDRNRLALQSDILSAAVLGIHNVLVLTGDHPASGDHPNAKAVYDLDSIQLIQAIAKLNSGVDMSGNILDGNPDIFPGAVVNPGADPIEPEIIKMEKKVKAGAKFFQTQAIFDINKFADFMGKIKHINVPVLAGIIMIKSASMAKYMNENISGIDVPDSLILKIDSAQTQDRPKVAIDIASNIIRALKSVCQGIHIMPLGWESKIALLLDECEL